jgi:hypothetical protein
VCRACCTLHAAVLARRGSLHAGADLLSTKWRLRPEAAPEPFIQRIIGASRDGPRSRCDLCAHQTQAGSLHAPGLPGQPARTARIGRRSAETRQTYAGPLEVGQDFDPFESGKTVNIRRKRSLMIVLRERDLPTGPTIRSGTRRKGSAAQPLGQLYGATTDLLSAPMACLGMTLSCRTLLLDDLISVASGKDCGSKVCSKVAMWSSNSP